jgi:hypothetical protein
MFLLLEEEVQMGRMGIGQETLKWTLPDTWQVTSKLKAVLETGFN